MKILTFNFSVDLLKAILWQYNDAIRLQTLLQKKSDWYQVNQTDFWNNWITNVFNLVTANDFGLSVWSVILDLPLYADAPPDPLDKPIFGFGDSYENFDNGNFASSGQIISLSLEEKRLLLRLRYFQFISRGAIPEANRFMALAFSFLGGAYVVDNLNMSMTAVFNFTPSIPLLSALKQYDLIPTPAGVQLHYVNSNQDVFGFGPGNQNFENGSFIGDF